MRHVLILGTGISGFGAAHVCLSRGDAVTISDLKENPKSEEIRVLSHLGAEFVFGPQTEALLDGIDTVIPAPVISSENPVISAALARGIFVISEIELAGEVASAPIYAITGTNGKTTTTSLLRDMFVCGGLETAAAGNIGRSLSLTCRELSRDAVIAAEISSFQLEFIHRFRPEAAVILNVTPDHLERHHTMEAYAAAKARIFENMKPDSYILLNREDPYCRAMEKSAPCRVAWLDTEKETEEGAFCVGGQLMLRIGDAVTEICSEEEIPLPGKHNVQNVLAAAFLAKLVGVSKENIRRAISAYKPFAHRIEFVCEKDGISFYDDSKATNTDSTEKALLSFTKPITLICGGYDKGTPLDEFMKFVKMHANRLVLTGAAAKRFYEAAIAAGMHDVVMADTMEDAVKKAAELTETGGVVLLSPACSSFDSYRSYGERGNDFREKVLALR